MDKEILTMDGYHSVRFPKIKKNIDGILKGEAVVTKTGVFPYLDKNGNVIHQLRHPDDVFSQDSLDSLKLIPITIEHPDCVVTSENAGKLTIGTTGDNVKTENNKVICSLSVFNKDGINAIKAGKKELSLGYRHNLIKEEGEFMGKKYTHRQINIEYNHLALVDKGRVGPEARLNLDSMNAMIQIIEEDQMENEEIEKNNTKKDIIDGNNNQKKDDFLSKLDEIKLEISNHLKSEISNILNEFKSINSNQIEKIATDSNDINKLAQERAKILNLASEFFSIDSLYEKTNREIKEMIIKSKVLDFTCDSKSDEYISGIFDNLIETHKKEKSKEILNKQFSYLSKDASLSNSKKYEYEDMSITDLIIKKQQNN